MTQVQKQVTNIIDLEKIQYSVDEKMSAIYEWKTVETSGIISLDNMHGGIERITETRATQTRVWYRVWTASQPASYRDDDMHIDSNGIVTNAGTSGAFQPDELERKLALLAHFGIKVVTMMIQPVVMEVMTASEAVSEFGLSDSAVRKYLNENQDDLIQRGVVRKSGKTWLISSEWAREQWGDDGLGEFFNDDEWDEAYEEFRKIISSTPGIDGAEYTTNDEYIYVIWIDEDDEPPTSENPLITIEALEDERHHEHERNYKVRVTLRK